MSLLGISQDVQLKFSQKISSVSTQIPQKVFSGILPNISLEMCSEGQLASKDVAETFSRVL